MTAAPVIDIPGLEDDDEYSRKRRSDPSDESEEGFKDSSVDSHEEQKFHDAPQHIDDYERRPSDASTDEAVIFDAYARESRSCSTSSDSRTPSQTPSPEPSPPLDQQSSIPPLLPPMPRSGSYGQEWFKEEGDRTPTQESLTDPLAGLRRPSPGDEYGETRPRAPSRPGGMTLQIPTDLVGASPPSPSTTHQSPGALSPSQYELPPGMAPPAPRSAIPPGIALQQQRGQELVPPVPLDVTRPTMVRSESGTSTASSQKEKEKEKEKKGGFFSKKKEKEKKSKEKDGFLGSLFGGKKKPEETSSIANFSSAGPAAAAALLGSSKSAKSLGLSPVPSPTSPGFNSFARYPIHVERAVYRLSHIKLANARRPLYEQVLISNLMFWYLGVIGRNVADEKKPNGSEEKQEEVKPAVRGTPPKASDSGIAGTIPSPKKTGLTKPDRSRGGRDNEAPVRTPSYGMQNALVDNELRNANVSISMKVPPRAQPQQIPQQHPSHHQQPLHQHISSIQTQSPQQIPGFTSQQRSGPVPPQPTRAFSSPVPAPLQRPMSDAYPNQAHMVHRDIQPPPRGPPQSSFGPPPPVMGQASQSQPILDGRDLRQRTLSNPPPGHPPPPNHAGMRRVVTDGRSPYPPPDGRDRTPSSPHGQHVGPQPGQIFAYPGAAPQPGHPFPSRPSPSPGHVFNGPQPGQAFHHPYPHPHGPFNGQRPPFDQNRPPPGHQQQWDAPIGLPPGASPGPGDQQYLGPPGQPHRRGPSPPTDQYDPRREQLPFSFPSPQQGGPPPLGIPNSHSSGPGFYPPAGVASIQPGQLFNPYAVRPMPARHTSGDDMYRTVQTVPGNQYGPHHR